MNQNNHLEDIIFDEEKVMSELEKLKNGADKISFINEVLLLRKKKKEYYDPDKYSDEPTLDDKLKNILNQITEEQTKEPTKKIKTEYKLEELIWWKGTEAQLEFLFTLLINANLIDSSQYNERFALIAKHFKNPNGKAYNNKQSSQAVRNLRGKEPPNSEKLMEIIKDVNSKK